MNSLRKRSAILTTVGRLGFLGLFVMLLLCAGCCSKGTSMNFNRPYAFVRPWVEAYQSSLHSPGKEWDEVPRRTNEVVGVSWEIETVRTTPGYVSRMVVRVLRETSNTTRVTIISPDLRPKEQVRLECMAQLFPLEP